MSITETEVIDAMGISKDGKGLLLLLSDHLDWENEAEHLLLLQDKINAYLGFIESGQYADVYPDNEFTHYVIEIRCKIEATENGLNFFDVMNNQLREYAIQVSYIYEQ